MSSIYKFNITYLCDIPIILCVPYQMDPQLGYKSESVPEELFQMGNLIVLSSDCSRPLTPAHESSEYWASRTFAVHFRSHSLKLHSDTTFLALRHKA